jgi:hypothetical protein
VVARAAEIAVEPSTPPELEALAGGSASTEEMEAARACGWLDGDGPTESLERLLEMRPVEREAAVRRFLRTGTAHAPDPDRLRAWRAWALNGRRRA